MDKTITRRATYGPFLWFVLTRYRPWRFPILIVMVALGIGYGLKLVNRARLKERNLALLLGRRIDCGQLADIATAFAEHTRATNSLAKAISQIENDRSEGYRLILATASFRFYAEAIGRDAFGFDHVIGTECQQTTPGILAPHINGENCYGPAKLRIVQDWLARQGIDRANAHIRFYSDHVSDEPCLSWADQAFATNPHAALRLVAEKAGWPVLEWAS